MNKEDVLEAYNTARVCKESYRKHEGRKLLQEMIDSEYTPSVFVKLCAVLPISSVSFVKDSYSGDYMPDFGWFICLDSTSSTMFSFLYEDTEGYREFADFFGDDGIGGQDDLKDAMEKYGVELTDDESEDLFEFVIGFGKEGLKREMYDYEGSEFS